MNGFVGGQEINQKDLEFVFRGLFLFFSFLSGVTQPRL
jgi:hypothetical protein